MLNLVISLYSDNRILLNARTSLPLLVVLIKYHKIFSIVEKNSKATSLTYCDERSISKKAIVLI